jgi:hypothetical protein
MEGIYLQAEKMLAELLGWKDIIANKDENGWIGYLDGKETNVPSWSTNDTSTIGLMLCYKLHIEVTDHFVFVSSNEQRKISINFSVHPDKETAMRYAIMLGVIKKLDNQYWKIHQAA